MKVRKIISIGIATLLLAVMLTGIPITTAQENQAAQESKLADKYPQLAEAVNSGKLPKALFETAMQFEIQYPRLVKAFKQDRVDYKLFRTAFRGVQNKDKGITKLVQALQESKIRIRDFQLEIMVYQDDLHKTVGDCGEGPCDDRTTVYYLGCRRGGGDPFVCFVIAEQFMCICTNAMCGYRNDCGVIDI